MSSSFVCDTSVNGPWMVAGWEDQNLKLLDGDVEVKPPLGSRV